MYRDTTRRDVALAASAPAGEKTARAMSTLCERGGRTTKGRAYARPLRDEHPDLVWRLDLRLRGVWVVRAVDAEVVQVLLVPEDLHGAVRGGGEPCERDGEFTFRITGTRKYWRMQQIDNPCDEVADYGVFFFR